MVQPVRSRWAQGEVALGSQWVAVGSRRGRGENFRFGSARLTNMGTRQTNDA